MNKVCCDACGKIIKSPSAYDILFVRNHGNTRETRIDICMDCRERLASSLGIFFNESSVWPEAVPLDTSVREILLRGSKLHDCLPFRYDEEV